MNRIDSKYHGGENTIIGIDYEILFAIKKLIEMLIPTSSGLRTIGLTRQAKAYVDDIVEEKNNNTKVFYQCKHFKPWVRKSLRNIDENNLWLDFLSQYKENSFSKLVLVTQNKDRGFDYLANLAKKSINFEAFINSLENDSSLKEELDKFSYLKLILKEENSDIFIFSFLKKFRIASYDDYYINVDSLNALMTIFSEDDAKNIQRLLYTSINGEWVGKKITRNQLIIELINNGVDVQGLKQREKDFDSAIIPQSSILHTLISTNTNFSEKLDYIFDFIKNGQNYSNTKFAQAISVIESDNNLKWHFLKNLDDPSWFPKIKDNIISKISEDSNDSSTKYQLFAYFKKCNETYSDEIIPFLFKIEKNSRDFNILTELVKIVGLLKLKSNNSYSLFWQIFDDLVEHQHPWVRKEIPDALFHFIDFDIDKVLGFLDRLYIYSPTPQDVTQGSPTLALTFQGRDNENTVFEEATLVLKQLLSNAKYAKKSHALARKIEVNALVNNVGTTKYEQDISIDYLSIWLSDESYKDSELEYNNDRKERIALEIEKSFNELVINNKELVRKLLNELLLEKREVFHLLVIKVLIKHVKDFPEICKELIFNPSIWKVFNIRKYYLQTLTNTYFLEGNENEISEFINIVNRQSLEDTKHTQYLQQDMLISIPEVYRTSEIEDHLKIISESLEIKPKIIKPFTITTLSGIRPDITIKDLESKNEDELIQIMIDSSNGKRGDPSDIAPVFSQLIDGNPDLLPRLLFKMRDKEVTQNFSGEMVRTYIEKKSQNIIAITDLIKILGENDAWAKLEITRYFRKICQKKEIQNYEKEIIEKIRDSIIQLTFDKNPESDNIIVSNNPQADSAVNDGINSVRGVATESLVAFCYYFPSDERTSNRLIELASDKTKAVKATLIYSLRDLVYKNSILCESIVNTFRDTRDPEVDYALIRYFSQLSCEKFLQSQDFIKLLFNDPDQQINEDLGELIGYRFIENCNVQPLLDEIIGLRKGTKDTRRSLAFVFESRLGETIGQSNDKIIACYLKKLMNPQNENEVIERASFVFQRKDIDPEQFNFLEENGLISELLLNKYNIRAQAHLVGYLLKCIKSNTAIDRCSELLHEQVKTVDGILSDQLIVTKIADFVSKLIKRDLSEKTQQYIQDIFNAGLERGWDEFYKIYFDLKKDKISM